MAQHQRGCLCHLSLLWPWPLTFRIYSGHQYITNIPQLFKAFMRHCGNSISPDEWLVNRRTNAADRQSEDIMPSPTLSGDECIEISCCASLANGVTVASIEEHVYKTYKNMLRVCVSCFIPENSWSCANVQYNQVARCLLQIVQCSGDCSMKGHVPHWVIDHSEMPAFHEATRRIV